ncbi:thiamine pyrophosphate enzyme [Colletotrichum scovillei]|uniref:Pyruvate decarboxylase n=1 Tax=Colletotrichum scovillei TaxID=1209932 RepID=A0A9P7QV87_9PEZI|nr:thiamine pyrophosphate enzyme [Colletotrichum scovillei]KAF4774610.1 thiamine pyrophosphate enzyme [Colletotrichum scovillei]KAG7039510.1 pyruvate decarboxylase [Colletotrichum scovillei]KAG7041688.1 pyruvate decarboxylase [Colletotrichum scovillei]KAG7061716.1 pyruvate decarboxylase [Colletotrichum scovillei]
MSASTTIATYLFTRLKQLGVGAIHGVPGDYNLDLLDYVKPSGLTWVGNANELNAAYAADGYARIKGIGAVITTFGVGELSAVNAIAGAYAELSPVVHIVGTPSRASQDARLLIHHTFADGDYGRFAKMQEYVTVAQTSLWDFRTATQQIDTVLQQCILHSRPVYIQIPMDLVAVSVPDVQLQTPLSSADYNASTSPESDAVLQKILQSIYEAKRPIIIADGECRPLGIVNDVQALIDTTGWPTWTTNFGKGLYNETRSNFHGIYKGDSSERPDKEVIESADLVLFFGPHLSSSNTYGFTTFSNLKSYIFVKGNKVEIGSDVFRDVSASFVTSELVHNINLKKIAQYDPYPVLHRDSHLPLDALAGDSGRIYQDKLWRSVANILRPGDIVLGETGTAGYGVREMHLPPHTRLFTPATWLSIGFMLPAAQGAALAQREMIGDSNYHGLKQGQARTILFIGDGSFQMTAQELATIIRHNLDVVIFLINNDGYTIERCIHGRGQEYNDIPTWRYLQAPYFFGGSKDTYTAACSTWTELFEVLGIEQLSFGRGLKMIEIFMGREDVPKGPLLRYLETQRKQETSP